MKIAHFEKVISPEVGGMLAGYGYTDVSVRLHDDLKLCVLLMDDGEQKGAILAFDLLGLDASFIEQISADTAKIVGCLPQNVMVSCTHTHSGPHSRTSTAGPIDQKYLDKLVVMINDAVTEAVKSWSEVNVFFYSCQCDENYNRRFTDGANEGKYLPLNRSFEPLATGFKDQELGMLIFQDPATRRPAGVLVNYAAHPLASHAMGLGALQISADFPGVLRDVMADTCCWCIFLQGAAGDQFPKDAECGFEAARRCANNLAIAVNRSICDALRNRDKYYLKDPKIRTANEIVPLELRQDPNAKNITPDMLGKTQMDVRLHLFAVGDICLIGVPGEMLAELGQEMKWHSPFRRTFIIYNSTGYLSYICHANAFIPGGYETGLSKIKPYGGLQLVVSAVEGMRKLHAPLAEEL